MKRKKLNVAVIMGGRTAEHEISLSTGEMIINHLDRKKYLVKPVIIDRSGRWHVRRGYLDKHKWFYHDTVSGKLGFMNAGEAITLLLRDQVEAVFIAMHGPYGEDGTIQGMLEILDIPYTGSDVCASALAMDKIKAKEIYHCHNIPTPKHTAVEAAAWKNSGKKILTIVKKLIGYPCVVKPVRLGSSVGLDICENRNTLKKNLARSFKYGDRALVEAFVKGMEVTCAVLDTPGRRRPIALPPTEIAPITSSYFDYHAKYTPGATDEITPARLGKRLSAKVQELALRAHVALGCSAMSRTDMIVKGSRLYVLETNTIPGMTSTSLLPQAARAMGLSFPRLLDRIIAIALEVHKRKRRHRR